MRVLKFGGSSLSDAERFLRVADIVANNAQQSHTAVVLSAPGKTTNRLVEIIRLTVTQQAVDGALQELQSFFTQLFDGIEQQLPSINRLVLDDTFTDILSQLTSYVEGMQLLGQCPDNVYARVISKGERISIVMMLPKFSKCFF